MKRRPRDIGTAAETATVRYLQAHGWPTAERRALRGNCDAGDITGTPGVCWEVKGGNAARTASDLDIERWMAELAVEFRNAQADVGLLVVQRAGVGPANAGRWWAWMPAFQLSSLIFEVPILPAGYTFPVRMLLGDAVSLLRSAGYGTQPRPVLSLDDPTPPTARFGDDRSLRDPVDVVALPERVAS
ncbi:hypothetical protein ACFP2T_16385 [Plantactinospora solaniradicis]|uniref:Holliday junction resolvase n=1 Tax=Plantactinospora solaniradicis TaxID=1723736 RepID=A0ABW1K8H8_9ACTN